MRQFPIQGDWNRATWKEVKPSWIPWEMIAPHEKQALTNHCGQSLKRLAERGGLGHHEAIAVLEDKGWREIKMDLTEEVTTLNKMVEDWNMKNEIRS